MVPAICGRLPQSAETLRQPGHRHRGFGESGTADPVALSFRPPEHAVPRVRISSLPGTLLVESGKASDASRMGKRRARAGKGCGQLYLVAVAHAVAQSE